MNPRRIGQGSLIGRYHVLEELGAGAMGVVYAAYDPDLDRKVALKLLRPGDDPRADGSKSEQRLLREAKAIAKLSHPNVVAIHDVGVFEGQVFLAMEFVGGGTLRKWLEKRRPWTEVVKLFIEVGRGLAAAHAAGLIHRDFKPENVLLDSDGRPRVVDFGLARIGSGQGDVEQTGNLPGLPDEADTRLTRTGSLLGTPAYMAPEQFMGGAIGARSDQFAFCVALFEALYGERPFKGTTVLALAASVSEGAIITMHPSAAPPWVRRIVTKGLSTTPEDRFGSMPELLDALSNAPAARWRRRFIAGGVALVLAAAVGGSWQAISRKRRQLEAEIAVRLVEAEKAAAAARTSDRRLNELRDQAFAAFDAKSNQEGERIWRDALNVSSALDKSHEDAERAYDSALTLDRTRDSVRTALAQTLLQRAVLAERDGRKGDLERHLRRLAEVDVSGSVVGRWNEPASLSVETDAPAVLTLERYRQERSGALQPTVERRELEAPVRDLPLAAGSYRLLVRARGRAELVYPVLLGRGERARVPVKVPPPASMPPGFVHVPAGRFLFGSGNEEMRTAFLETIPLHQVHTQAFLIARQETTMGDWIDFLNDLPKEQQEKRRPQGRKDGRGGFVELRRAEDGSWELRFRPTDRTYRAREGERFHYAERTQRASQDWRRFPVAGVSPDDALEYAAWLDRSGRVPGARLCTEHEWERAARGADAREFPHGNELWPDDANFDSTYGRKNGGYGPDEVGSHPASRSPFGVDDLVGNVWEITRSVIDADQFVARGGSFYQYRKTQMSSNRDPIAQVTRDHTLGLRICASPRL